MQRSKTPDLVPEDSEPLWSIGAQSILSKSMGIKHRIYSIISRIYDHLGDPRIGPMLLLGALMSFGTIWLVRGQPSHRSHSSQPSNRVSDGLRDVLAGVCAHTRSHSP